MLSTITFVLPVPESILRFVAMLSEIFGFKTYLENRLVSTAKDKLYQLRCVLLLLFD